MTTLVIGARGTVGRHVVEGMVSAGERVRASTRDIARAAFPSPVEVVQADLTVPGTLTAALDGVHRAFLYVTDGLDEFATAARRAGVETVVLLSSGSVLLPWGEGNAVAEAHRRAERTLVDAALHVVPIRPLVFAGNASAWAPSIRRDRSVALVHPESVAAPIHERDVAAVAVAALRHPDTERPVSGLLTGAEPLTRRQQVALVADAIGEPVAVTEIDEATARERLGPGADTTLVDAVLERLVEGTEPDGWELTGTVRDVLGRDPLPFARWARDHVADFR